MTVRMNVCVAAVASLYLGIAGAQEVVRIGHVAAISGASAHIGKDNENGARMAIEELNAKGVVIGGKKVHLELVAEDDASDPRQAAAAAQKLVDENVNGVVGHQQSGTSIPASRITAMPAFRRYRHLRPIRNTPGRSTRRLSASLPMTFNWAAVWPVTL